VCSLCGGMWQPSVDGCAVAPSLAIASLSEDHILFGLGVVVNFVWLLAGNTQQEEGKA